MARIDIDGAHLEVLEKGRGDPVVLVHGSASDHRTWRAQIEPLAERFRVIAYSRRHHWPNAGISDGRDYSMSEHVEDLESLLGGLNATPAHLVGHSYGGFLCLLLAVRAPHLVRTLVLTEPPVITLFVSDPPKPLELVRLAVTRPRTAAAIVRFGAQGVAPAVRAFRRGDAESGIRAFGDAVFGGGGYNRLSEARKAQVAVQGVRPGRRAAAGSSRPASSAAHLLTPHAPLHCAMEVPPCPTRASTAPTATAARSTSS